LANNIKTAEQELQAATLQPGHHVRILQLIADASVEIGIRQAAGIHFKNSVKFHWEDAAQFPADAKDVIRQNVVDLMCRVPEYILQELLSESISLIAKSDYPDHWTSLLPDLVHRLQTQSSDSAILNGLLKTANSIFKAFRYVQRSDELYRVIIYTLQGIQEPISLLFTNISAGLKASGKKIDPIHDEARLESLRLICRIFYSLNYQDLPEYFEDNMRMWMEEFGHYLTYTGIGSDQDESPNGIDRLQSAILAILDLYADRDEEPFQEYLPAFTKLVWELLNSEKPRHDTLTVASIQFLSSLIEKPAHHALFENPETIKLILVQIIIPNLAFRESDMEKFEDDPADFMLTEVEGSSSESRRRKAQICLKSLCKSFNDITVALVQEHVALLLADFQRDPNSQWAKKDVAVCTIIATIYLLTQ
jgi:exportin-2 (importin alpha re-exporter)